MIELSRLMRTLDRSVDAVSRTIPDAPVPRGRRANWLEYERQMLEPSPRERGWRYRAAFWLTAIVLHGVAFAVTLPQVERGRHERPRVRPVPVLARYVPPPVLAPATPEPGPPVEAASSPPSRKKQRDVPPELPPEIPPEPPPVIQPRPQQQADPAELRGEPAASRRSPPETLARPLIAGIDGVSIPALTHWIEPEYPPTAKRARIEGRVVLRALITKDGTVSELRVLSAPAAGVGLGRAAVEAVRQWRYRPAVQDGHAVDVYFTVFVNFSLD